MASGTGGRDVEMMNGGEEELMDESEDDMMRDG